MHPSSEDALVQVYTDWPRDAKNPRMASKGIFSYTPEPHIAFLPLFLSTHFFPCLFTIFKNGSFLSVVALVSVTLLDSNPRPSAEKRSILAPTPASSLARTTTKLNFPVKNDVGQKQYSPCFLRMRRRPEGRRRLHKNTAYAHLWEFSRPFC